MSGQLFSLSPSTLPQNNQEPSELSQIQKTCQKLCKYLALPTPPSWEDIFFLSLQTPLPNDSLSLLLHHFQVFEKLSPTWKVHFPSSLLLNFTSYSDRSKLILQIIDFAKGRFWIECSKKSFLCILPLFERKLGIFGVIFKTSQEGFAEMMIGWLSEGLTRIQDDAEKIRAGVMKEVFDIDQEILIQTSQGYQPKFFKVFERNLLRDLGRNFCEKENQKNEKEIWFLYEFPQGFSQVQVFICFDHCGKQVQGELNLVFAAGGKNVFLVVFKTDIQVCCEYFFKVLEPKIVPGITFYENLGNRRMDDRNVEILFDVCFDKTMQNRNVLIGNPIETFQAQIFYFFCYLVRNLDCFARDELFRTCKKVEKGRKLSFVKNIVFFDLVTPNLTITNSEELFTIVSSFAFQLFIPSETEKHKKQVRFILKSIINHGQILKTLIINKPFSRIFMKGLAVLLASGLQMKITQVYDIPELFDNFSDNFFIFKIVKNSLKLLKTSSSLIGLNELMFLVKSSENLPEIQKSIIGESFLGLSVDLQTLIKLIQLPLFNYMKNEEKSHFVSLKFISACLNINELLDFLHFILQEPEKSSIFIKSYQINHYLEVFLNDYLKTDEKSLEKILKLFKILKADKFFASFSPKSILFKSAEVWSFNEISKLLLIYPSELLETFNHWISIQKETKINELILMIDSQLVSLPCEQQRTLSEFSVNFFKSHNFKDLLQTFDIVKTKTFRKYFLKNTLEGLLNTSNKENLMKDLILKDFPGNENSLVLRQIIFFIESKLDFSLEFCHDLILENPSKINPFFVFLDKIDIQKNSGLFRCFYESAMKFIDDLQNGKITVKMANKLMEFDESQKNAFFAYFELALERNKDLKEFSDVFVNVLNKIQNLKRVLKQLKTFIYKFHGFFDLQTNYKELFESFSNEIWNMTLSSIDCPKELKGLFNFLESLNLSLSSKIFLSLLKSSKKCKNLEEKFLKTSENLKEFLLKITSKDTSLDIQILDPIIQFLETSEDMNKECKKLFNLIEQKERFSENFYFFTLITVEYRFFIEALFYFKYFLESFKVPCFNLETLPVDFSRESINIRAGVYREVFGDFDSKTRENLKIFMQVAYEKREVLALAQIFNEEEIKFCIEFIELFPNIDKKSRITLNSFWKIWNFVQGFQEIDNFRNILKKILDLCENLEFFAVLEDFESCGSQFEVLKEFRDALESFEYEKIMKIMAVYSWSSLEFVIKKFKFDAILTVEPTKTTEKFCLNLKDLKKLTEKAEIMKKMIQRTLEMKKKPEKIKRILKNLKVFEKFQIFYKDLCKITNSLNYIFGSPYFYQDDFCQSFDVRKAQIKKSSSFIEKCLKTKEKWQKELKEFRTLYPCLNYFNRKRLSVFFEFFSKESKEKSKNILKLVNLINPSIKTLENLEKYQQDLTGLKNFLKSQEPLPEENNENFENSAKSHFFFKYSSDPFGLVLDFYQTIFNTQPTTSQIFTCNSKSTKEDISLFILRFSQSSKPSLFSLLCPEDLPSDLQVKSNIFFQEIFKTSSLKSSFLLVSKDPEFPFKSFLSPFEVISSPSFQSPISTIPSETSKLKIIQSSSSGQGKTSFIAKFAEENKLKIETIHIDQSLNFSKFVKNFEKILEKKNRLFHLNLAKVPFYFEQILFGLEIFNLYFCNSNLISIHQTSWFFIEIVNGYEEHLFKDIPFLRRLQILRVEEFSLSRVEVDKEIAFVSRYLQICEDRDLDQKFSFNVDLGFSKEIQETFEFFFLTCCNRANFHQLKIFTKVMSCLLENYEKSELFFKNLKKNPESLKSLTTDILQSLLETTKSLLSKPNSSFKFHNFSNFLTFFNESGDFLFLYKSPSSVPISISNYLTNKKSKFWSFKVFSKIYSKFKSNLENFSEMTSQDLLRKLLNFNIMSLYKKAAEGLDSDSILDFRLKELNFSDFFVTLDNFWKMNMIFLKGLAKVPVFICGGRGTGKTSLLKFFLQQVLQERVFWLDVDSKTCFKDFEDLIVAANSISNDFRTWVVFDSFGGNRLDSEIFGVICDRVLKNQQVDEKIVFVAICRDFSSVVPFPEKVLEFVWDFGKFEAEDVKSYAFEMITKAGIDRPEVFSMMILEVYRFFIDFVGKPVDLKDLRRFVETTQMLQQFFYRKSKFNPLVITDRYEKLKKELESFKLKNMFPGVISIFLTYSFKLDNENFEKFFMVLGKGLKKIYQNIPDNIFLKIIEFEQLDFIYRFQEFYEFQGISEDFKLQSEFLAIFYYFFMKIPVFLTKKIDKDALIQIFSSNFLAEKSLDQFFKTLPEIKFFDFKISDVSGDLKNIRKKNYLKNALEVFVIDESFMQKHGNNIQLYDFYEILAKNERKDAFLFFSCVKMKEIDEEFLVIN